MHVPAGSLAGRSPCRTPAYPLLPYPYCGGMLAEQKPEGAAPLGLVQPRRRGTHYVISAAAAASLVPPHPRALRASTHSGGARVPEWSLFRKG